jgi:hypothetical protein
VVDDHIRDGVDGWELDDFTWDEKTGIGRFEYVRLCEDLEGTPNAASERRIVNRLQPYHPSHAGWYTGALK